MKCSPRPVTFLKTHKTASTSLTNIILRYAEKNNFLVGLPPTRKWELGGYPAKFKPELVDPQPSTQGFEVLAHHFRWSDEVEKGKKIQSYSPEMRTVPILLVDINVLVATIKLHFSYFKKCCENNRAARSREKFRIWFWIFSRLSVATVAR